MADALVSTPVAAVTGAAAIALLGVAGKKIQKNGRTDLVPLMGVMGAFIFAAQMLNFTIPGTGSSGHIVGGVLLAALLGPWAGFITLSSVIIIQCLLFADGGLFTLGCNIINMGACTALLAYPLIFRPLIKFPAPGWKIFAVSVLACVVGLEAGACLVVAETKLSGITALPANTFLGLMSFIHLAIGIGEGLATGAVIWYVQKAQPSLLMASQTQHDSNYGERKRGLIIFGVAALLIGGILFAYASANPDGLEWSIMKLTGDTELSGPTDAMARTMGKIQSTTALMPDYDNTLSGIIGGAVTLVAAYVVGTLLMKRRKRTKESC